MEDALEAVVREGARRMLAAALDEEVTAFLGRRRYERGEADTFRGYRSGYHASREMTVGVGAGDVRVPRGADVPAAVVPDGFQSQLVRKYQRASVTTQRLLVRFYLEGLATGDFEPVFRELVGETTARSPNAIVRLKQQWADEYAAWRMRSLTRHQYAYIWADGVYLDVGQDEDAAALLCVCACSAHGRMDRKSCWPLSWATGRTPRGGPTCCATCATGACARRRWRWTTGRWAWGALALRDVFPTTRPQRCWNQRVLNVQDKLPKRRQGEARQRLRALMEAETRVECERRRDAYMAELRAAGQAAAAATVRRDWDDFVMFYQFPTEHWVHLRPSNPLASVFAGVRLRTNAAKRMRQREAALCLVFKVIEPLRER